jgi:hypothetical protein
MTLLAGTSGTTGSADGTGAAATFNRPIGITYDSSNLYVADYGNYRIRRIDTTTGAVTTLTTTGFSTNTGTPVTLLPAGQPTAVGIVGIAYNGSVGTGTFYYTLNTVGVYTISNVNTASVPASAVVTSTGFTQAYGIVLDQAKTSLYVADKSTSPINFALRKVTISGGAVTLVAGTAVAGTGVGGSIDATGSNATFNLPRHFAIDSTSSNLYIADSVSHKIRKIQLATTNVTTYAGTGVAGFLDGSVPTATNVNNTLSVQTISNASNILSPSTSIMTIGTNTTSNSNNIVFSNYTSGFIGNIALNSYNIQIGNGQNGTIALNSGSGNGFVIITAGLGVGINCNPGAGIALDVNGGVNVRNGIRTPFSTVASGVVSPSSSSYGTIFNITSSAVTQISLPTVTWASDVGAYWTFRNNTSGYLPMNMTYSTTANPAGPTIITIPPSNSVTILIAYSAGVSCNYILM